MSDREGEHRRQRPGLPGRPGDLRAPPPAPLRRARLRPGGAVAPGRQRRSAGAVVVALRRQGGRVQGRPQDAPRPRLLAAALRGGPGPAAGALPGPGDAAAAEAGPAVGPRGGGLRRGRSRPRPGRCRAHPAGPAPERGRARTRLPGRGLLPRSAAGASGRRAAPGPRCPRRAGPSSPPARRAAFRHRRQPFPRRPLRGLRRAALRSRRPPPAADAARAPPPRGGPPPQEPAGPP